MKWFIFTLSLSVSLFAGTQKFSEEVWEKTLGVYQAIQNHPFNQELVKGTLAPDRFAFYSEQDSLYLVEFAKALAILGTKLEDKKDIEQVFRFAKDCLKEEKKKVNEMVKMAPANFSYTQFLLATAAFKTREELAAALLPCFWIYQRLASEMKSQTSEKNPYFPWISLYSNEKYLDDTQIMIAIVDRLAEKAEAPLKNKMQQAFETAMRMEWLFWESAYQKESWKPLTVGNNS